MYKVIIIHGAYGYPEENWFPWLKGKLEDEGVSCIVPQLPTPKGQSLKNWKEEFYSKTHSFINSESVLIGHSLGAAFLLRLLEESSLRVKAAILVGAFLGDIGVNKFDVINKTFFMAPFYWAKIRANAETFIIFHGTDDPYVPFSNVEQIAKNLNVPISLIPQGGHLNIAAGYSTFPQLLNEVISLHKGKTQ